MIKNKKDNKINLKINTYQIFKQNGHLMQKYQKMKNKKKLKKILKRIKA